MLYENENEFSGTGPDEKAIPTNLSDSCEKLEPEQNQEILSKIQDMFSDNKGWNSEDDMINDLADFRKSRNALRLYPYIKNKTISHGKAAEILGVTKYELISLYDKMGLPYLSMDIAEVEEEVLNWQIKKDTSTG